MILNVTVLVVRVWWRAKYSGTDIEYYSVCCESLEKGIYRGTDTECYCVCCDILVQDNIERN